MKSKRGFTLIETIISLGILALIAVFLLPSLASVYKSSFKAKEETKVIYALEEAIETEKSNIHNDETVANIKEIEIDGILVEVSVNSYRDNPNLYLIKAKSGKYSLEVIEVSLWKNVALLL